MDTTIIIELLATAGAYCIVLPIMYLLVVWPWDRETPVLDLFIQFVWGDD